MTLNVAYLIHNSIRKRKLLREEEMDREMDEAWKKIVEKINNKENGH